MKVIFLKGDNHRNVGNKFPQTCFGSVNDTLGYKKFLHPMGSQEVTSLKPSDNRRTIAGCKMVLVAVYRVREPDKQAGNERR